MSTVHDTGAPPVTRQPPIRKFDIDEIRKDFPILGTRIEGRPLVYLDNAATSQKPHQVIEAISDYYRTCNSNVHRGVHYLSQQATEAYEGARKRVKRFINAPLTCEVIFTRGTTESINLVAQSFARERLQEGDEILITHMEHHSNIVPWQIVCEQTGAKLRVVPINDDGELVYEEFEKLLNERTKLLGVVHISNALGTVNPIKAMIERAHAMDVPVLVDAAQSAPHTPIDVQALDCDFLALSGHKMCGPTGIGVLYGKAKHLNSMPPYQGGGDMIASVRFEKTTYNALPYKFEAGTPHVAGVVGLGAAIEYLEALGMEHIQAAEAEVLDYGTNLLQSVEGVRLIGTAREKAAVLSFIMDDVHPHDIGQILSGEGVAIRAGHHCAQPVMERYGVAATARASLAFYNSKDDIDALARGLEKVKEVFG